MLTYLTQFAALSNAVCLHNAYFLALIFANAFCFHALSWSIDLFWSTLAMWLECRFMDTEVGFSKPGISMLSPCTRHFIRIATVDSSVK